MTKEELLQIEVGIVIGQHTLQSLVPIVLVNENKVWRHGQPQIGKQVYDALSN